MSGMTPDRFPVATGAASVTDTTTTTLIAAPDSGHLCITSLQLGRSDAGQTAITVTLNDTKATVLVLPGGPTANNGASISFVFDSPLVWANRTAMTMKASSGVSTLFGSAQGFTRE